jgi:broad specificity phosphatase PhoE
MEAPLSGSPRLLVARTPCTGTLLCARRRTVVKRVFFVRHGHAQHNDATEKALAAGKPFGEAALIGGLIRDPALTPKGEGQAKGLPADTVIQKALRPEPSAAEVVVVSPCRRTLQTAVIGLEAAGLPFVAHDSCQECADTLSDTGRPVSELTAEFPAVDFSQIEQPDSWFNKVGPWDFEKGEPKHEGQAALQTRCARFTQFIAGRCAEHHSSARQFPHIKRLVYQDGLRTNRKTG